VKPATERQQRARKRKSCLFTSLKNSCAKAELVEVEGVSLLLCEFHHHNLLAIVADARRRPQRIAA
jgi:hypothetical protein